MGYHEVLLEEEQAAITKTNNHNHNTNTTMRNSCQPQLRVPMEIRIPTIITTTTTSSNHSDEDDESATKSSRLLEGADKTTAHRNPSRGFLERIIQESVDLLNEDSLNDEDEEEEDDEEDAALAAFCFRQQKAKALSRHEKQWGSTHEIPHDLWPSSSRSSSSSDSSSRHSDEDLNQEEEALAVSCFEQQKQQAQLHAPSIHNDLLRPYRPYHQASARECHFTPKQLWLSLATLTTAV